MANRIYSVTVTLPELSAAHAEQQAKTEAGSWPLAVRLACEEISKRPHVRGKHIKSARITFSVLDKVADKEARERQGVIDREGEIFQEGFLFEL